MNVQNKTALVTGGGRESEERRALPWQNGARLSSLTIHVQKRKRSKRRNTLQKQADAP
ncbi:hypothetical protein D2M30_3440 [Bacillus amyloliquefaciens]|nr:hypothetical protein D2M30_3440 [Bacillus amyloliquefaciens]